MYLAQNTPLSINPIGNNPIGNNPIGELGERVICEKADFETLLNRGLLWKAESVTATSCNKSKKVPFQISEIDRDLGGIKAGTIHEWFTLNTPPATIISFLAGNIIKAPAIIVWIGKECRPTPYILKECSPHLLTNSFFIEPPNEKLKLWAIDKSLRSPAVKLVISSFEDKKLAANISRRFLLAAEEGGSIGFFIRDKKLLSTPSFVSFSTARWLVSPAPSPTSAQRWQLSLMKIKGSQPLNTEWIVEHNTNRDGPPLYCPSKPHEQLSNLSRKSA